MIKIQKKAKTKEITGSDEAFKGTKFEGNEFSVKVKELRFDEKLELNKALEKDDNIGTSGLVELTIKLLQEYIVDWSGFVDDDNKELKYSKKEVKELFGYNDDTAEFASILLNAIEGSFVDEEEEKVKKK